MKKTAVEWLVHELGLDCTTDHEDEIHEALQMEKDQIIKAFYSHTSAMSHDDLPAGESYYNKTYNQ